MWGLVWTWALVSVHWLKQAELDSSSEGKAVRDWGLKPRRWAERSWQSRTVGLGQSKMGIGLGAHSLSGSIPPGTRLTLLYMKKRDQVFLVPGFIRLSAVFGGWSCSSLLLSFQTCEGLRFCCCCPCYCFLKLLICIYLLYIFFWGPGGEFSQGFPVTPADLEPQYVDQPGLSPRDPTVSASPVQGLQACPPRPVDHGS